MKNNAQLLIIRLKPQGDITSHMSEWLSSMNQQTTSTGKDVENRQVSIFTIQPK